MAEEQSQRVDATESEIPAAPRRRGRPRGSTNSTNSAKTTSRASRSASTTRSASTRGRTGTTRKSSEPRPKRGRPPASEAPKLALERAAAREDKLKERNRDLQEQIRELREEVKVLQQRDRKLRKLFSDREKAIAKYTVQWDKKAWKDLDGGSTRRAPTRRRRTSQSSADHGEE